MSGLLNISRLGYSSEWEMTAARKAERQAIARAKRERDLNQIASQNGRNEDGVDPLEIFPEELWVLILAYLVDPADLESAGFACPEFQKLLAPRRLSDILLPMALNIPSFRNRLHRCYSPKRPQNLRGNEIQQLLPLRAVCKSWKFTVDTLIANNVRHIRHSYEHLTDEDVLATNFYPFEHHFDIEFNRDDEEDEGDDDNDILGKLKKLNIAYNPGNEVRARRFIQRSIRVFVGGRSEGDYDSQSEEDEDGNEVDRAGERFRRRLEEFRDSMSSALDYVGRQVISLKIVFGMTDEEGDKELSMDKAYELLCTWLVMTPNVEFLKVEFVSSETREDENTLTFQTLVNEKQPPPLRNLSTLTLSCNYKSPKAAEIFSVLLRSNRHIPNLAVSGESLLESEKIEKLVTSLQLNSISVTPPPSSSWSVEKFSSKMFNKSWPLTTLRLGFCYMQVSFRDIFQLLRNYQDSLEQLYLHMECVDLDASGDGQLLELPNLKYFSLVIPDEEDENSGYGYFSRGVDYLLDCKKLERITWLKWANLRDLPGEVEQQEVINFDNGRCIPRSNIWTLLPRLEGIELVEFWDSMDDDDITKIEVYRRAGLRKFIRKW